MWVGYARPHVSGRRGQKLGIGPLAKLRALRRPLRCASIRRNRTRCRSPTGWDRRSADMLETLQARPELLEYYTNANELGGWKNGLEVLISGRGPGQGGGAYVARLGAIDLIFVAHAAGVLANIRVPANRRLFLLRGEKSASPRVNGHLLTENRLVDQRPGTRLHLSAVADVRLIALLARVEDL